MTTKYGMFKTHDEIYQSAVRTFIKNEIVHTKAYRACECGRRIMIASKHDRCLMCRTGPRQRKIGSKYSRFV